ncbi:MAG: DUF1643 domain-containing protein [Paludibacter sp.]|nr:DUF1643 domain-containing protein [Paludibacter sp.]
MKKVDGPYIGRQIKHFEKVDVDSVEALFSSEETPRFRYRLKLPYFKEEGRHKTALVLLKNPSSADQKMADKTVQNVEKVIYKTFHDVGTVEVANIYAMRGTKPKDVQFALDSNEDPLGPDNDLHIANILAKSDYVVIAWGGASPIRRSSYDKRVDEVLALIKENFKSSHIYRKANKGSSRYPYHACYWPDSTDFVHYISLSAFH